MSTQTLIGPETVGASAPTASAPDDIHTSNASGWKKIVGTLVLAGLLGGGAAVTLSSNGSAAEPARTDVNLDLVHAGGFGTVNRAELRTVAPVTDVTLGYGLVLHLPDDVDGTAASDGTVVLNGLAADGGTIVTRPDGFGVITADHGPVEYRYPLSLLPGATLTPGADGGLEYRDATGGSLGRIDPAYAVDETGTALPASYTFDATASELVVTADTSNAVGQVFIDPSWRCTRTIVQYLGWGALAILGVYVAAFVPYLSWLVIAWFNAAPWMADRIALACANG